MTLPNVTMLRDFVMIRPMPLYLKKTADGLILPGDVDKMSPKRATVVAAGPGDYKKDKFIPNPFKISDQVLYMERGVISTKVDGEDFFILKAEDIIVKLGQQDLGPMDTLQELSDEAYFAETMRRTLISHLKSRGLTRVQDMLNPVETYIAEDGETVVATSKSFMLEDENDIFTFTPDDGIKAFAMLNIHFIKTDKIRVVVRLAFIPR
jgi:co-chaperonin GroES (HSP10)